MKGNKKIKNKKSVRHQAIKTPMDTKEKILDVAEELFAKKGFSATKTYEIAKLAGINKSLIHYYFATKDKLYQSVLDRILFDLIKLIQDISYSQFSSKDKVIHFFNGLFNFASQHKYFSLLSSTEEIGENRKYLENIIKNFFAPIFKRGAEFFDSKVKEGIFKEIDGKQFIITIYIMIVAYFNYQPFFDMLFGEDTQTEAMIELRRKCLIQIILRTLGIEEMFN